MRKRVCFAMVATLGVFAVAGVGIADDRTITDAEGDLNGPPHMDFVSGTQGHESKKVLFHTATVAGKADEKTYPKLFLNTKGKRRTSAPEYVAQVTDEGAGVTNLGTGETKPLAYSIGTEELVNTYRYAFRKAAIGKPKRKYGWMFAFPGEDRMPNDNFAVHNLKRD